MADIYDLDALAKRYYQGKGINNVKAFNFGRVKCKIVGEATWRSKETGDKDSATRVVELINNSSERGHGNFSIEKKGKPVFKFQLDKGIVRGLPYRVKFNGPNEVIGVFMAPITDQKCVIQDYMGIRTDTTVPLSGKTGAIASVSNKSNIYTGTFSARAQLSGKVFAIKEDDTTREFDVLNLLNSEFLLKGRISIEFQNCHNIEVKDHPL